MPLGRLEYLYMGSTDVAKDVAYYRDVMGAEVVWDFSDFGTRVAGLRLWAQGPMLLLAGHRAAPSVTERRREGDGKAPKRRRGLLPSPHRRLVVASSSPRRRLVVASSSPT